MKISLSTIKGFFNLGTTPTKEKTKYHKLDAQQLEEKEIVVTQKEWRQACLSMVTSFNVQTD